MIKTERMAIIDSDFSKSFEIGDEKLNDFVDKQKMSKWYFGSFFKN